MSVEGLQFFTPSEYQSVTESRSFKSSFRVGVAGAVRGETIKSHLLVIYTEKIFRCEFFLACVSKVELMLTHISSEFVQDLDLQPSLLFVVPDNPAWNVHS